MINPATKSLYQPLFWTCLTIGGSIFAWVLYASLKARQQSSKPFHRSPITEFIWQLIPLIIALLLIWPTIQHIHHS